MVPKVSLCKSRGSPLGVAFGVLKAITCALLLWDGGGGSKTSTRGSPPSIPLALVQDPGQKTVPPDPRQSYERATKPSRKRGGGPACVCARLHTPMDGQDLSRWFKSGIRPCLPTSWWKYEAHLSSAARLMLTWHANLTRCLSDLLTLASADLEVVTLSSRPLPEKVSFVVLSANVQQ